MSTIKGLFSGYSVKSGTGKNGKEYKLYTLLVDNKKYGFGFNPPKAAAGDYVQFEAAENDRGYLEADPKSFKVIVAPAGAQAPPPPGSGSVTNNDPRQGSIELQSSISSASRIVAAQITAGVNISNPASAVASLVDSFINILHPKPASSKAAPKPKPVEEESQDPDDDFPA